MQQMLVGFDGRNGSESEAHDLGHSPPLLRVHALKTKFTALAKEIEAASLPEATKKILAFLAQIRKGEIVLKP